MSIFVILLFWNFVFFDIFDTFWGNFLTCFWWHFLSIFDDIFWHFWWHFLTISYNFFMMHNFVDKVSIFWRVINFMTTCFWCYISIFRVLWCIRFLVYRYKIYRCMFLSTRCHFSCFIDFMDSKVSSKMSIFVFYEVYVFDAGVNFRVFNGA